MYNMSIKPCNEIKAYIVMTDNIPNNQVIRQVSDTRVNSTTVLKI